MTKHLEYLSLENIIETWNINRINLNQLKLEKTIAEGGQGKTKLGKYFSMNVIVKILHKLNIENFLHEILISYKYKHPSIPKLIGIYESHENYGIVFEFIEGLTLSNIINLEKKGKLNLNFIQKLEYLIQLISSVEFFHSHSIIHRDLKTDNIIIDFLGNLKVLDFGIAIIGNEKWINMDCPEYCFTPCYMAPEITIQTQEQDYNISTINTISNNLLKEKFEELVQTEQYKFSEKNSKWILINNKYDIWTLGIIMVQLFSRSKPWCRTEKENISELEAQNRLLMNLPYPIPKLYPEKECKQYDLELKEIFLDCLKYDPLKRPAILEIKNKLCFLLQKELSNIINSKHLKYVEISNQEKALVLEIIKKRHMEKRDLIRNQKIILRNKNELNFINSHKIHNKDINTNFNCSVNLLNENKNNHLIIKENLNGNMLECLKNINLKQKQKLSSVNQIIKDNNNL